MITVCNTKVIIAVNTLYMYLVALYDVLVLCFFKDPEQQTKEQTNIKVEELVSGISFNVDKPLMLYTSG